MTLQKAWEMATATAKSLPMNAFMLYMSGSGVQIFSIMMTAMQLWNGFQGLVNTDKGEEMERERENCREKSVLTTRELLCAFLDSVN